MIKKIIFLSTILAMSIALNAQVIKSWTNGANIKEYKLTQPGTYRISGKVTGNINVELNTQGDVIIEGVNGTNPVLQGIPRPGEKRAVGHVKGNIGANSSITIRNLTLSHNGHHIIDFGGDGYKHIKNCTFYGEEHKVDGVVAFGVAPGNMGGNGLFENSYCQAGDDGHQPSVAGSVYKNNDLIMYDNGSAIQLGWKSRFTGAKHICEDIRISGNIKPNINGRTNSDNNVGRSVIAGAFNNNGSNIQLTKLDINVAKYNHLIKLVAGTESSNKTVKNITIQGVVRKAIYNSGGSGNLKAISLHAKSGCKIENMVIDLGNEVAKTQYHSISGNVNVKFLKSDGSVVEYKNGKLQSTPSSNYIYIDHNSSGTRLKANASGGAVGTKAASNTGNQVQWEQVSTSGNWFYLVHRASGRKLQCNDGVNVVTAPATNTGNKVQWRWIDAGGGWYRLENRQYVQWLHIKPDGSSDFKVGPTSWTGNNTKWKYSAAKSAGNTLNQSTLAVEAYPNPANDYITLEGAPEGAKIAVYNLQGQQVFSGQLESYSQTFEISSWGKGLVMIHINNGISTQVLKVNIQ